MNSPSKVRGLFNDIETGRNLGKDYEHWSLQLDLAHLAFDRWISSIKVVDSNDESMRLPPNLPVASKGETETVKKLLGQIETAFRDAQSSSQRYDKSSQAAAAGGSAHAGAGDERELAVLGEKVRAGIRMRQKVVVLRDKIRWVVHDSKVFEKLTSRVSAKPCRRQLMSNSSRPYRSATTSRA